MAYKMTGKVLNIGTRKDLATRPGAIFYRQDVTIQKMMFDSTTGEMYAVPQDTPKFSFTGPDLKFLDNVGLGELVTIGFDVLGRQYVKDGTLEAQVYDDVKGIWLRPCADRKENKRKPVNPEPTPAPDAFEESLRKSAQEPIEPLTAKAVRDKAVSEKPSVEFGGDLPF